MAKLVALVDMIQALIAARFTGRVEINFHQGTIGDVHKHEVLKLA